MKLAVILISNPDGGDESLARLFNALTLAYEARQAGDDVAITFVGTGTKWPEQLSKIGHPGNNLYNEVRDLVKGASRSCALKWGATESVQANGLKLLDDNKIPGTVGGASIRHYLADGWQTLVF